jgi:AraC-like DNA-binding protein
MLDAHDCREPINVFNVAYSIAMLHTWTGEVLYKGRRWSAGPGIVFCTEPGEIHVATPYPATGGSFDVFIVDGEVFREHVAEHGVCNGNPIWQKITHTASPALRQRLSRMFGMARHAATSMQLQCALTELVDAAVGELLERRRASSARLKPAPTAAEKIRDCIRDNEPGLDLEMLARTTGLSRFQVIRSFKRRYGLPPQTYQLYLKIVNAQRMLRRGTPPVDVALECGFVDQSHLGRHFKRLVGMTPGEYMRTSTRRGRGYARSSPGTADSSGAFSSSKVPGFAVDLGTQIVARSRHR